MQNLLDEIEISIFPITACSSKHQRRGTRGPQTRQEKKAERTKVAYLIAKGTAMLQ